MAIFWRASRAMTVKPDGAKQLSFIRAISLFTIMMRTFFFSPLLSFVQYPKGARLFSHNVQFRLRSTVVDLGPSQADTIQPSRYSQNMIYGACGLVHEDMPDCGCQCISQLL